MDERDKDKPAPPPTKRGGLGRGLGALIPSAPLSGAAGKGHFWNALDNPPSPDAAAPRPTEGSTPSATSVSLPAVAPPSSDAPAAGSRAEAALDPDVSRETSDPTEAEPASTSGDAVDVSRETSNPPADGHAVPQVEDSAAVSSDAAVLIEVDPTSIVANPKNPRQVFDEDKLAELAESVGEFGLLQPIVVRRREDDALELVMGERRLRASRIAGLDLIPVIVRQTDDDAMLRDALLENIHRVQLHPLEEAAAYQQLIDEFGVTHDELAQRIKRSRPVISNTIRLLKLPTRVQNRVAAGIISGSHARALLALDSAEDQEALATRIVAEGLSVRATEEAVTLANGESPRARTTRRRNFTAPALSGLAEKLSDHFETKATVALGRTKGKIVVEFASVDDLERIVAVMAPHLATDRLREQVIDEARDD